MSNAREGAIFLHCLPAYRGEEVTDEVLDSENSPVFDEAETGSMCKRPSCSGASAGLELSETQAVPAA